MNKHLISIADLKPEHVKKIFSLCEDVKHSPASFHHALRSQKFALIFEKPSTRTWVSFDAGVFSLGGSTVYLGPSDIKLGVREETRDVARVLDRYLSGVVMRTYAHETITEFQKYFTKPVINGLSDKEHPCQALADFFTIRERFPEHKSKTPEIAFVGDGNNVLNSLLLLAALTGGIFRYATPKNHEPSKEVLEQVQKLASKHGATITACETPAEAVKNSDVIYGDVWVSMGEEDQREEKLKDFDGFQINRELVSLANKDAIIMHCLPAHRGEEITDEVIESENSVVFDQAENRLHVQKAVLLFLCAS